MSVTSGPTVPLLKPPSQLSELSLLSTDLLLELLDPRGRIGIDWARIGTVARWTPCAPAGTSQHLLWSNLQHAGKSHEGLVLGIGQASATGDAPTALADLLQPDPRDASSLGHFANL
jgi:hypothetical protein